MRSFLDEGISFLDESNDHAIADLQSLQCSSIFLDENEIKNGKTVYDELHIVLYNVNLFLIVTYEKKMVLLQKEKENQKKIGDLYHVCIFQFQPVPHLL